NLVKQEKVEYLMIRIEYSYSNIQ
ncbi:hypothetical protein IEC_00166, partial [Bacillus toyonensis]